MDTSAEAASGAEFDYLVVGAFEVPGVEPAMQAPPRQRTARAFPPELRVPDFLPGGPDIDPVPAPVPPPDGTVGWISYGRSSGRHPALAPPQMLLGETDPRRSFLPDPATGTLTSVARIGLAWSLQPQGDGGPIDAGAVRYDVEVQPEGAADWTLLTPDAKAVVAASVDELGTRHLPERTTSSTTRRGHARLPGARDRHVRSAQQPRSRPLGVAVADVLGPPPPVNLWTRYLDPADPYLAAGEESARPGAAGPLRLPARPVRGGRRRGRVRPVHRPRPPRPGAGLADPATWGAPVASVPHQAKVAARRGQRHRARQRRPDLQARPRRHQHRAAPPRAAAPLAARPGWPRRATCWWVTRSTRWRPSRRARPPHSPSPGRSQLGLPDPGRRAMHLVPGLPGVPARITACLLGGAPSVTGRPRRA